MDTFTVPRGVKPTVRVIERFTHVEVVFNWSMTDAELAKMQAALDKGFREARAPKPTPTRTMIFPDGSVWTNTTFAIPTRISD